MSPAALLLLAIAITAAAAVWDFARHRRNSRLLRQLAGEWRMNYSPADPLRLTDKVAGHFPVPGAANVRVTDVIYGSEKDRYRYVFSVEYTTGVVRTKHRHVRVATFSEPRDRDRSRVAPLVNVTLAPAGGGLVDQYRRLAPAPAPAGDAPA